MKVIEPPNGEDLIFQDREVSLGHVDHADVVAQDEAIDVRFQMWQSPLVLGGVPTDPNYCFDGSTGRKVRVLALVDGFFATERTYCIAAGETATLGVPIFQNMQVPIRDDLDITPGETELSFLFLTGDTGHNQFRATFEGAPESMIVSSVTVEEGDGNGNGTGNGDGEWVEVDDSGIVEEGDRVRVSYCVQALNIPFNDVITEFQITAAELTGQLNHELDCLETQVVGTDMSESQGVVVDGDECEFIYTVDLKVTGVDETCDEEQLRYSSIGIALRIVLAAVILGGINLFVWQTERLLTGESGERISALGPGALLLGAGALFVATRDGDDD